MLFEEGSLYCMSPSCLVINKKRNALLFGFKQQTNFLYDFSTSKDFLCTYRQQSQLQYSASVVF